MTKLERIWKDKWVILKAIFNTLQKKKDIELMAIQRQKICKSNKCGKYDSTGLGENVFIKGKPACGICGCSIGLLTRSKESNCSLIELNEDPLWKAES